VAAQTGEQFLTRRPPAVTFPDAVSVPPRQATFSPRVPVVTLSNARFSVRQIVSGLALKRATPSLPLRAVNSPS